MSEVEVSETTKNPSLVKNKLKVFLSIIRDFQNYLKFKNKRDEQLEIDNTQLNLFGEIITTKNLKKLIISVESKFSKEKPQQLNINSTENIHNSLEKLRQCNVSTNGRRNNKCCFGQSTITSKNVFYVSENEKNLIKESTLKIIKTEIKKIIYSQLLSKENHYPKSSNFVLRNVNQNEPYSSNNNLILQDYNYILQTESSEKNSHIENKYSYSQKKNHIQRNFIQVGNLIDSVKYKCRPFEEGYNNHKIKHKIEKLKELYSNIINNKISSSKGNLRFDNEKERNGLKDLKNQLFSEQMGLMKIHDYHHLNTNEHDCKLNNFLLNMNKEKSKFVQQSPNKVELPIIGKEEIQKNYSPSKLNRKTLYNCKWNSNLKKSNFDSKKKIKIALHYEYR